MSGGSVGAEEVGPRKNVFGESAVPDVDLNLTALMDILSNLLFFLLASFGATILMSINATVPVQSANESDLANEPDKVTVNVSLSATGYGITLLGTVQKPEELDRYRKTIPLASEQPDYPGLAAHLATIKAKYPKSETLILTPETGVSYDKMIRTMDAARQNERLEGGNMRITRLFPSVVVSTVLK